MNFTVTAGDLLYGATNNTATTLALTISDTTSNIAVSSVAGFPGSGVFSVEYEVIRYTSIAGNVFQGCTRGYNGTTAAYHNIGTLVELRWVAAHHNILANEIINVEGVLGATVSGAYTTVNDRLVTFEATWSDTLPMSGVTGSMHYRPTDDTWFIYNGSTWTMVDTATTLSGDYWAIMMTPSPSYVYPNSTQMVDVGNAIILNTSTISDALNSLSGKGALGRDDDNFSYKTPDASMVPIVRDDRIVAPRAIAFGIDSPIENKISSLVVIPDGNRNIRNVKVAAAGTSGTVTVSLNRVTNGSPITSYETITACSVSIASSLVSVSGFAMGGVPGPGSSAMKSYDMYSPSVGESGTITIRCRTMASVAFERVLSTTTMGAATLTMHDSISLGTYTFSKTGPTTILLNSIYFSGQIADISPAVVPFDWVLLNSSGMIAMESSLSATWAALPGTPAPYIPPYFPGDTISGSQRYANNYIRLDYTITMGSSDEVVSVNSVSLGTWNDELYSISSGDVLFTKVDSITGSINTVVTTVEAPYFVL